MIEQPLYFFGFAPSSPPVSVSVTWARSLTSSLSCSFLSAWFACVLAFPLSHLPPSQTVSHSTLRDRRRARKRGTLVTFPLPRPPRGSQKNIHTCSELGAGSSTISRSKEEIILSSLHLAPPARPRHAATATAIEIPRLDSCHQIRSAHVRTPLALHIRGTYGLSYTRKGPPTQFSHTSLRVRRTGSVLAKSTLDPPPCML